jgi:hypothetical protein
MRGVSDTNILDEFAVAFTRVVERHCQHSIISDYVVISSGRTRATEDIDIILELLSKEQFISLHQDLVNNNFICIQSEDAHTIYEYLEHKDSVRYAWAHTPLPEMEVKFSKDPLDEYQLSTRTKISLTGLDLWFSTIEVNLAFKELLLASEKDLKDAEHLRKVYEVDESEVHKVKALIKRYRL